MAISATMSETHCHLRSISMPSKPHLTTLKVQDTLSKLRSPASSSKAKVISNNLTNLVELYNGVEHLLQLPLTQQVLVKYPQHKKWVEDVLDGSVRTLDTCSTARDALLQLKEKAQDLQTFLRRRGESIYKEEKVGAYISFRKKMKKDVSKCIDELKRMDNKCPSFPLQDQDQHLAMVIKVLQEVKAITISFFQSLMSYMQSSPTAKSSKWLLLAKLKYKRQISCEGEHEDASEIQSVDIALQSFQSSKETEGETVENAKKVLEAMQASIEGLESGLECLFKHLIQSQVTLLNVVTY